jgi:hypothetical protein
MSIYLQLPNIKGNVSAKYYQGWKAGLNVIRSTSAPVVGLLPNPAMCKTVSVP